ncbi:MAG: efflux RND transporter periplasmic adaptor subunit [Anaerolineales bacterium]|jgi:HlyD family secretion protein|nr:efflux RND transporter periplasmic adaptor subunit [Anaerolineales bacterium]MCC6985959.1 efflux RND transporter periplasmic adaptor subunit [Anaerolineales bacterium]
MKHKILFLPILLALLLTACGTAQATPEPTPIPVVEADDTIIAEGRLEPATFTEISLNASGLISDLPVEEGDKVSAGDVLAVVESENAQTLEDARAKAVQELTAAYQEYRDTQSRLDDFDVPTRWGGMTPTDAIADTLVKLNVAREEFEPYKHLDEKQLKYDGNKIYDDDPTPEEEDARLTYDEWARYHLEERPKSGVPGQKKKALDEAWQLYRVAIRWLELESAFQNAQVRIANAEADFTALEGADFSLDTAALRAILANAELRASHSGIVTNLDLKVGEYAAAGSPVVTIADTSRWLVKTSDLTEIDVVNIKEGQPVTVKLDSMPGVEFKGNVLAISQEFSENQGDVVYEVTILLTDFDPAMRWGMTAVVTFD